MTGVRRTDRDGCPRRSSRTPAVSTDVPITVTLSSGPATTPVTVPSSNDSVVVASELTNGDVRAHGDVAEETQPWNELGSCAAGLAVLRCKGDEPNRAGGCVKKVHEVRSICGGAHADHSVRCVNAGGAGTDDGHTVSVGALLVGRGNSCGSRWVTVIGRPVIDCLVYKTSNVQSTVKSAFLFVFMLKRRMVACHLCGIWLLKRVLCSVLHIRKHD